MSLAHICNTFFEKELENPSPRPLIDWLRSHPVVLQLQFLPLLYAAPNDLILVSDLPENPDPRLRLIEPTQLPIETWGPSLAISRWAKQPIPNWETIRTLNSKIFSFTQSPQLPGAALLTDAQEAAAWMAKTPGPKVLKTPFGTAGNGHIHNFNRPLQFPLIGEPWVERLLDFSTQWKDGELLGATIFENDAKGSYKNTLAGPPEKLFGSYLWALEEHLNIARPLITHFPRGHVGIDAFIYRWEGKILLHPIVEINARKTMSWVALQMQQNRCLRFTYSHSPNGLLPSRLKVNGKTLQFSRNVVYSSE
ncbi:MAG TPA: hypothetical protein VLE89_02790 [Chlamydiales bacterium]|nr:hypothetical protein [Chlamydiales bacterium]